MRSPRWGVGGLRARWRVRCAYGQSAGGGGERPKCGRVPRSGGSGASAGARCAGIRPGAGAGGHPARAAAVLQTRGRNRMRAVPQGKLMVKFQLMFTHSSGWAKVVGPLRGAGEKVMVRILGWGRTPIVTRTAGPFSVGPPGPPRPSGPSGNVSWRGLRSRPPNEWTASRVREVSRRAQAREGL